MSIPSDSSVELRAFIVRHEGLDLKAYKCPRGFWTWGVGCRITDPLICEALDTGVVFELTSPQAESLLTLALSRATRDAIALFPSLTTYNPPRQTAIVSLSYQFGKQGLAGVPRGQNGPKGFPNMCKAIRMQDWSRAADELRFRNGLTKAEPSDYAVQCPERCKETALLLETGEWQ